MRRPVPRRTPIPIPDFLTGTAIAPVLAALADARVVGGAVRDTLAGIVPGDIDLATALPPDAVIAALRAAGLRALPTGLAHGTVTALSGGQHFEITTLRRDLAGDGRHARVAFTDDWQADAARRDFTFNALSLGRDGTVFDYFTGLADLAAGRVRFVGRPGLRIAEDYLRILRFFRFHARFGRGAPGRVAMAAIRAGRDGLARLSGERVRQEIFALLRLADPLPGIAPMARAGVLESLFATKARPARLARLIGSGAPADPLLRLAALLDGADPQALAARLRLSSAEAARLAALYKPAPPAPLAGAALARALADTPPALLRDRSFLAEAAGRGGDFAALRARITASTRPVFPLRGADATALGLAQGPAIGALLSAVRNWWLAGGCVAGAEACRAELARRTRRLQAAGQAGRGQVQAVLAPKPRG